MSETIDALLASGGSASSASPENGRKAYTVEQYNKAVERKMKEFPRIWVKGVLTQINARGKAVYMELADFAEDDARPKAVLPVMMWAWDFEQFAARFAQLPTPFELRKDLKVSFQLESSFYVPTGRFQPKVVDVDESFTLGELALTRKKILDALRRDGLLERNKGLELADAPLRVGLISAPGSAAYQDFTTVLLQSGFSFEILFHEAKMQGQETETTVSAALAKLSRLRLDAICIIRGGGSKTDLVFFDSEAICRAIALCPVPVFTGIGHEIDLSLADIVANRHFKTPTECAKFLEGCAGEAMGGVQERADALTEAWDAILREQGLAAMRRAQRLRTAWDFRARREMQRQAGIAAGTAAAARRLLREVAEKLRVDGVGLARGPDKILRVERVGLGLKEKLLQASDPAALLRRGFAQVVAASGTWIRGARDVAVGDAIRVRFADGSVGARIENVELNPAQDAGNAKEP